MQKTVIIIAGPTASGKTALAIRIAQLFNTAVISADSRQCYREISIGTAKPTPDELAAVPHYFIDSHSIREEVNAGIYEKLALQYAGEIFSRNNIAVMCGGTGLYIKAFTEGIDDMPAIPPGIREHLNAQYVANGITWLQQQLQERDPAFYATAETQNPQRLIRALEVLDATGQSVTAFRKAAPQQRDFRVIKIGITLPKELLHERIHHRVDLMMAAGLVEEVKAVLPYRQHNALRTVGYQEIFDYLDGQLSLEQAAADIKTHTRQYAKRQLTWFRKDTAFTWYDPREEATILAAVQAAI
ncbi:tRNA (adenosine(37)-N6)-dimethylallyltransferase MiaA [Chitinophaga nivalis]|uniref:tRNA dimethylallyltransferase n=1 Tax=Chitinophaga nivalis TaxID=2991709 RepID=A0ABT3IQP8_9BACT|nr:tRNA (adenosine(37)-N6)-dimethylallyltransferase MiaA [Chitinophaga nivalis]MCW3464026.1 tRNA (adenosine(37)-N6)-dimethylallyltransferase MiaA [Chitinophaga nivalis]MCW3486284.1 tRNA (adenosine(37)-N6)-dimethylallyltransferase MiaA [Chitinophaga nivalis]